MKRLIIIIAAISLLLAACKAEESDIQATSETLAHTMVAETQAAQPTESPEPTQANTSAPSPTSKNTSTATPTSAPTNTITPEFIPSETPWFNANRTARLRFENNTDETIFIILSGTYYVTYNFQTSWNMDIPWGSYNYSVYIGKSSEHSGSFTITNADKHIMVISEGKVRFKYP